MPNPQGRGPTIQEMAALRDALNKLPARMRQGLEPDYAAAVTAAEQLAKALAKQWVYTPTNGITRLLSIAMDESADLLDRLAPGWRERKGE